jgi:uncharacterized membrane protein
MVNNINARLDALEKNQPVTISPPTQPTTVIPPAEPSQISETEIPQPVEPVAAIPPEKLASFLSQTPPEEEPPVPPKKERAPKKEREWEQILGGNWLARIGAIALIIGIGFFLKYAFDNNWIGPTARVILGSMAGIVMLGLGFWWRKRYPILTQVLSGGGIAVLYLSVFASSVTYNLINIFAATALLLAVSILATLLALRYNSIALSIIGIFGAYFAPFILGAFSDAGRGTDSNGQAILLLVYIIVIGIGVIALSAFRSWRWFTLIGLVCSLVTYGFWFSEFHRLVSIATAEIGVTAIFLIFTGATSLFHIIRRRTPEAFDYILMLLTATAYAGISLGIMWDRYRVWMGGFTLLLAIFYGVLTYLTYKRNSQNPRQSRFLMSIGLFFLTAAIPIQFGDHATATIAFAVEGAVLMWLAFKEKINSFRYYSYIVFCAMAIRLFGFDTWLGRVEFKPIFNERFLAFIVSIIFTWLAAYLLGKNQEKLSAPRHPIFVFAADFLTMWIIGIEVLNYSQHEITPAATYSLFIILALVATTLLNLLIWRRKPEIIDKILTVFNAVALIIISIFIWHDLRLWMGTAYLLLAIFYGILTYHAIKKTNRDSKFDSFTLIIAMVFLSTAIPVQFSDGILTPVFWAVEMAAGVWLSFILKLPYIRYISYIVFMAMAWALLIFGITMDKTDFTPVINQRFLAFFIGIVAAYFTFFGLWRKRKNLREWPFIAPFFLIITNFITLWIISFETWDTFSKAISSAGGANKESLMDAQNLSLTGAWAICAVIGLIIGIKKHWRFLRIGSLVLLTMTIIKVFAYDVFKLEMNYRIGAFVGLGILLLLIAYLYQRYKKAIKGVFTEK